jgi:hypothetical protein
MEWDKMKSDDKVLMAYNCAAIVKKCLKDVMLTAPRDYEDAAQTRIKVLTVPLMFGISYARYETIMGQIEILLSLIEESYGKNTRKAKKAVGVRSRGRKVSQRKPAVVARNESKRKDTKKMAGRISRNRYYFD